MFINFKKIKNLRSSFWLKPQKEKKKQKKKKILIVTHAEIPRIRMTKINAISVGMQRHEQRM